MIRLLMTGALLVVFISTVFVSFGYGAEAKGTPGGDSKNAALEDAIEEVAPTNPEQLDRNPFVSYMADEVTDCKKDDVRPACKEKGPLEKYPAETYRLTTILVMGGKVRAIVIDKESEKHFVFVGNAIGNKGGTVVEIGNGRIVVEEPIKWNDDGSAAAYDRIEISLPKKKKN